VRIRIGKPIQVTRYLDRASDRMILRQITDEVMFEIRNLSGQQYVNEYATKKSETLPAETAKISREGSDGTPAVDVTGQAGGSDAASGPALPGAVEKLRRSSADVLKAHT
jgi:1-acyl-sn-glycerol-3-phosphate acyltransferase